MYDRQTGDCVFAYAKSVKSNRSHAWRLRQFLSCCDLLSSVRGRRSLESRRLEFSGFGYSDSGIAIAAPSVLKIQAAGAFMVFERGFGRPYGAGSRIFGGFPRVSACAHAPASTLGYFRCSLRERGIFRADPHSTSIVGGGGQSSLRAGFRLWPLRRPPLKMTGALAEVGEDRQSGGFHNPTVKPSFFEAHLRGGVYANWLRKTALICASRFSIASVSSSSPRRLASAMAS